MDEVVLFETLAHIYKRVSDGLYLVIIFFMLNEQLYGLVYFFSLLASSYGKLVLIWGKKNGKAVPLQAFWSGPEGYRKLRFPDYMTTAQDCGKFVRLTHRPPLPPGNVPGTHLC